MTKYGARPVEADGYRFDSQAEYRRYLELMLLDRAGEIIRMVVHPKFDIVVNGVKVCRYEADFQYIEAKTDRKVVEDVKGVRTAAYVMKKKLMKAVHGIEIVEVEA